MSILKKFFDIIFGKKYRKCPSEAMIYNGEKRALQAGLINSEQIMAYSDSYTTGLTGDNLSDGLSSSWGITSPQEAVETLTALSESGHRYFYDIIYRVYSEGASEGSSQKILDALVESGRYGKPETVHKWILATEQSEEKDLIFFELKIALGMFENLSSIFRVLKDKVNGSYGSEDYSAGILAWDLGRLVTVARMSFDCGYLEQHEVSQVLAHVDRQVQVNFSSWPQFAKSYIIGRAIWSGQNVTLGGIIGIAEDLMTDKHSPWVLSPL
ncbi:DUF1266 domain-containing protein [Pseudomonas fragi]|uniref:DUF1266 domain-containing protein n=1 Tax=Pseudomonas fragi TaxID=296 RepID=UPI0021C15786|nr:DUF1266 domain-containing protein [Pseudomonas fragi]UXL37060.1 DUF1266 domain-containing protein [Pseudomonas fragi]